MNYTSMQMQDTLRRLEATLPEATPILSIFLAGLNITRLLGIVISSDIVGRGPDFDGRPQHVGIYLDLFGDLLY